MRVIVPFTRLADGVYNAASTSGYAVELHDVSGSDMNYHHLLADLWKRGESFVVVEQDVLVASGTLASFVECESPWCSAHYKYLNGVTTGLGCTRFRQSLLREFSDVMSLVADLGFDGVHESRHFCVQDAHLRSVLGGLGVPHCGAHGQVEHLGDNLPSHLPCRRSFEQANR